MSRRFARALLLPTLLAIPACAGQRVVFTKSADLQPGAGALLECE